MMIKHPLKITLAAITLLLLASSSFAQKYGKDSSLCVRNMNIFHPDVENKSIGTSTLTAWRWCYKNCPQSTKLIFTDGDAIYKHLVEQNKTNKELKAAYVDTLMMLYDTRIQYFGEEAKVLSYKALYLYKYENNKLESLAEVVDWIEKSNELSGTYAFYYMPQIHFGALLTLAKYDKIDKASIIDKYFVASEQIDAEIAKKDRYEENWIEYKAKVDEMMEPFLKCDELLPIYDEKLKLELTKDELGKMLQLMEKKRCQDSKTYKLAAQKLCALEPSSKCKSALADIYYREGNYSEATKYVNEAISLEKNAAAQSQNYLILADIYLKQGSLQSTLNACNKALEYNPNNGNAYILIAGVYASMAKNCKDFDAQAAYWVIVDTYAKAKSVDASISDKANSGIAKYSKYFPSKQDIFFKNLKIGDSYQVDCLGKSTIIRAKVEE